jgi:hypothetical protein
MARDSSNGFFGMVSPHEMLEEARREIVAFCDDPTRDRLRHAILTLSHLREYVCPEKWEAIKSVPRGARSPEQRFFGDLYDHPDGYYRAINSLGNAAKHWHGKTVTRDVTTAGFTCGVSRCGDRLGPRHHYFLIDGAGRQVDIREALCGLLRHYDEFLGARYDFFSGR